MMTKVLFVCMGNICRSPSAEGVFRHLVNDAGLSDVVRIDSAGTHAFHIGEAPDARAQAAARKRGYEITHCEARQVTAEDFRDFDLILVESVGIGQESDPFGTFGGGRPRSVQSRG